MKQCHYEKLYRNVRLAKSRNQNVGMTLHLVSHELSAVTLTTVPFVVLVLKDSKEMDG